MTMNYVDAALADMDSYREQRKKLTVQVAKL